MLPRSWALRDGGEGYEDSRGGFQELLALWEDPRLQAAQSVRLMCSSGHGAKKREHVFMPEKVTPFEVGERKSLLFQSSIPAEVQVSGEGSQALPLASSCPTHGL